MFARIFVLLALVACTVAFMPTTPRIARRSEVSMSAESMQQKIAKALGVAAMGIALAGPVPAMADGAVSRSTVYRARNNYGAKIYALSSAASSGNFAAFEDKKTLNAFDLFISGANALNGIADKEAKAAEKAIYADIYSAVKAKDAGKLKANFDKFIAVRTCAPRPAFHRLSVTHIHHF
jgi:orotate phosphoribosyltransferase-like protein